MSVLWKKTEFYKGQSDFEAILTATCGLGQNPGGISTGKAPHIFSFLMSLRQLNELQWH